MNSTFPSKPITFFAWKLKLNGTGPRATNFPLFFMLWIRISERNRSIGVYSRNFLLPSELKRILFQEQVKVNAKHNQTNYEDWIGILSRTSGIIRSRNWLFEARYSYIFDYLILCFSMSFSFFFHFLSAAMLAIVKQNFYYRKSLVNMIKRLGIQRENHFLFFLIETWKTYRILYTCKEYIEAK